MVDLDKVDYQIENVKILNEITISIARGEKIAIIGSNGCGKTTLVKLIDALIFPSSGNAEIFGLKSSLKTKHQIHKKIGYLFQHPQSYFVGNTVKEDIAFTLNNFDAPRSEHETIIKEVLKKVGLENFEDRTLATLSGGEKQKVSLATNIAIDVELLILDEATSSLDEKSKEEVMECVLSAMAEKSLIAITHNVDAILFFDKVIAMDGGKIVAYGTTRELLTDIDLLNRLNVEPPFAVKVYDALRTNGVMLSSIPLTESELLEALC